MRVALIGWEIDDALGSALADEGLDLVGFTRWFEGQPHREGRGGWIKERCPHRIGGGASAEAWSFRESVLDRDAEFGIGSGRYDIVHALDVASIPAAEGLAERRGTRARVICVPPAVDDYEDRSVVADRRIVDHPWTAECWRARHPGRGTELVLVPTRSAIAPREEEARIGRRSEGPRIALWTPQDARIDGSALAGAMLSLRAEVPGLVARVLGVGTAAEALRRSLDGRSLLAREPAGRDHEIDRWSSAIASSLLLGVPGRRPADDSAAWAAWLRGVAVVGLEGRDETALTAVLRGALFDRDHMERVIRAGAARARNRTGPRGVARAWARVYLDAILDPSAPEGTEPAAARPRLPIVGRSRLRLLAVGPREAYACWHVRPDDWRTALAWLGRDAVRASLVLRLADITDLDYDGTNARASWDVPLTPEEHDRPLRLESPGRSLVASLGVASPRGAFLPLARAGPVHLSRQEPAVAPPTRQLRALPRR